MSSRRHKVLKLSLGQDFHVARGYIEKHCEGRFHVLFGGGVLPLVYLIERPGVRAWQIKNALVLVESDWSPRPITDTASPSRLETDQYARKGGARD